MAARKDLRQRFEREARAIARLNHPHVCALHDIGSHEGGDFPVMEYLEGERLSERLKKGPLPLKQLLQVAMEITSALEQAHKQGVIHRDLKPGNIMQTEGGAKLLDFDLAKRQAITESPSRSGAATQSESLTDSGMILGTMEYMAPEQVVGKEAPAFRPMAGQLSMRQSPGSWGWMKSYVLPLSGGMPRQLRPVLPQWFSPPGLRM